MSERNKHAGRKRFPPNKLPRSRTVRIAMGTALVVMGIFGFLPILGFWMIPLGLVVLSVDFHMARRFRRRLDLWLGRRQQRRAAGKSNSERQQDE